MKTFPNKTIDLFIEQGTTFSATFPVQDIGSYTFYAGVRKTVADEPYIDFTSTADVPNSQVKISLTPTQTLNLKFNKTYIYSLLKKNNIGEISTVVEGNVIVDPGSIFKTV